MTILTYPGRLVFIAIAMVGAIACARAESRPGAQTVTRVPVVFSGGHETDPRDRGRPVILIAAALGVPAEVFRGAFSHVHPADTNVGPTGDEARKNKAALMDVLAKYGITNERLDTVSNYYRYVRSRNELWTHTEAKADALVKNGVIIGYEISQGGSGYSSPPAVSVPGFKAVNVKVDLAFTQVLETNGGVAAIAAVPAAAQ